MKIPFAVLALALAVPALAQSPAPPTPPDAPPAAAAPKAESPPAAPAATAAPVAPVAQAAPPYPDVKPGIVDGRTAFSLVAAGVTVVDVRTARKDEIGPRSIPVLVYCRSGRRSAIAAAALQNAGFEKVYDLQSVSSWPGPLSK
jgi:phage shock protein E